jgi:hypothetical protein
MTLASIVYFRRRHLVFVAGWLRGWFLLVKLWFFGCGFFVRWALVELARVLVYGLLVFHLDLS